jgi:hypothetical protein
MQHVEDILPTNLHITADAAVIQDAEAPSPHITTVVADILLLIRADAVDIYLPITADAVVMQAAADTTPPTRVAADIHLHHTVITADAADMQAAVDTCLPITADADMPHHHTVITADAVVMQVAAAQSPHITTAAADTRHQSRIIISDVADIFLLIMVNSLQPKNLTRDVDAEGLITVSRQMVILIQECRKYIRKTA